ncbi:MAG: hypothetical protein Kow00106_24310 [Anaerolineae bacterium]
MSRDLAYLLDILDAARLVQRFAQGMDRAGLAKDTMRQYAILHAIQIIGEAARRVSDEFRGQHPEIPWRNIIGMRNRLVHKYDDVDLDVVWHVIQREIPELILLIEPLVPPNEDTDT